MALEWTDKANGVDIVDADDINSIANAVIDNEAAVSSLQNDKADLESGVVPMTQLPSGVKNVVEAYYDSVLDAFLDEYGVRIQSEKGKIYIDVQTNKCYRATDDGFVTVTLEIGESFTTAFAGNRGVAVEQDVYNNYMSINELSRRIQGLESGITAEETARIAADSALDTRVTALEQGGTIDAYSRTETDALLAEKADADDVEELHTTVYGGEATVRAEYPFDSRQQANSAGAISSGSYWSTGLRDIPSGASEITYSGTIYARYGVNFYDENGDFISGGAQAQSGETKTFSNEVVAIPQGAVKFLVQTNQSPPSDAKCSIQYQTVVEGLEDKVAALDGIKPKVERLTVGNTVQIPFYISSLKQNGIEAVNAYNNLNTTRAHSTWIYCKGLSTVPVPTGFAVKTAYCFDEDFQLLGNGTVSGNGIAPDQGSVWVRYVISDGVDATKDLCDTHAFTDHDQAAMDGTITTGAYFSTGLVSIPSGTRELVYSGTISNCYGVNFYDENDAFLSGACIAVQNVQGTPTGFQNKVVAVPGGASKVLAQTIETPFTLDGRTVDARCSLAIALKDATVTVSGADASQNKDDSDREYLPKDMPVDPEWERWKNERYSWGFEPNTDKAFVECDAPLEANMISVKGGKGRWHTIGTPTHTPSESAFVDGGHLFEGWNADETMRLTMLIGKYDYKMACIQCYGTPALNQGERIYGYIKVGSDNTNQGVNFGEKSAKFFVPLILQTRSAAPTEVSPMFETGDSSTVPVGAMYYDTTADRVKVMTANGWKSLQLEA